MDEVKSVVITPGKPYQTAKMFVEKNYVREELVTLLYRDSSWWTWQGQVYGEISEDTLRRHVYTWLSTCEHYVKADKGFEAVPFCPKPRDVNDVLDCVQSLCLLKNASMPFFLGDHTSDPRNIIAFKNGLLDVEEFLKGEFSLMLHTPYWISTNCLPFDFDPEAVCPMWQTFVRDVMSGDLEAVDCLQKWFGLNLTQDMRYQKLFLLTGTGRNGKGVLLRILMAMLGSANYCTPSFAALQNEYMRSSLLGKLAAVLPDAHLGRDSDAIEVMNFLKAVTGEDPVDLNRKYKDPLTGVKLTTRFTIACNEVPRLPDASKAIGARMIFIPFHQCYKGREDLDLDSKLAKELPGILAWSLDGLRKLREAGKFVQPKCGESLSLDFDDASSPIHAFVEECCEVGEDFQESKDDVRRALNAWLEENGHKSISSPQITTKLRAVNSRIECQRSRTTDDRREQFFKGIKLRSQVKTRLTYLGSV